jgi:hypothetical protein
MDWHGSSFLFTLYSRRNGDRKRHLLAITIGVVDHSFVTIHFGRGVFYFILFFLIPFSFIVFFRTTFLHFLSLARPHLRNFLSLNRSFVILTSRPRPYFLPFRFMSLDPSICFISHWTLDVKYPLHMPHYRKDRHDHQGPSNTICKAPSPSRLTWPFILGFRGQCDRFQRAY